MQMGTEKLLSDSKKETQTDFIQLLTVGVLSHVVGLIWYRLQNTNFK